VSDRPSALRSTVLVSATRATAAALALAQGIVSAHLFGTSYQKDAYLVAQTIPSMVATFLVGGIYWTLFAHLGAVDRREGARGMRRYLGRVLLTLGLALAPVVIAIELFPSPVVALMAPGFTGAPAALAGALLRLTLLGAVAGMVFTAVSALFHSRGRFAEPTSVNLLPPVITLILLLCCADSAGIRILAIGPLYGSILALGVLSTLLHYRVTDAAGFVPVPHDGGEMRGLVRGFG
jgi:putative peptidoglycan lipid II flippase